MADNSDSVLTTSLTKRYKDAYLVARVTVTIGRTIKVIGIVLGVVIFIAILAIAGTDQSSHSLGSSTSLATPMAALLMVTVVGMTIFIIGVLIAAQIERLLAVLDNAVNTSPFLDNQDRTDIMSLAKNYVYPPPAPVQPRSGTII